MVAESPSNRSRVNEAEHVFKKISYKHLFKDNLLQKYFQELINTGLIERRICRCHVKQMTFPIANALQ